MHPSVEANADFYLGVPRCDNVLAKVSPLAYRALSQHLHFVLFLETHIHLAEVLLFLTNV